MSPIYLDDDNRGDRMLGIALVYLASWVVIGVVLVIWGVWS
jgi:hypothetical protein